MTVTTQPPQADGEDQACAARSVTFIRFFLRLTEPGGVTVPGVPHRNEEAPWGRERAHLLVDTDPWDRPHLPGTSLAGMLRDMVSAADGEQAARDLFGYLLPAGTGKPEEVDAKASLLWVLGTRPVDAAGRDLDTVPTRVRASTAISRTRGAAEANTLRIEELLPAGTRFEVFLRWDEVPSGELSRLLSLLGSWRPLIGRGTSRGRGRCAVEVIRHGTLRLDDPAGVYQWLTLSGPELARAVAATEVPAAGGGDVPEPVVRADARIAGPLRIGSGEPAETSGSEGQQVTPLFRDGGRYLVPGTGMKGLLRSRAEFILRSVGMQPAPCADQRCGKCWTCEAFGHAGGAELTAQAVGARAQVRVTDAVISDPVQVRRQHVAIDRFTGGAHEGLLYTVDALEGGSFPVTVEPLASDLTEARQREIRAVLRLVLEDLNDGITGIGAGVSRGYGSVSVDLAAAEQRHGLPDVASAQKELARMVAASKAEAS